MDTTGLKAALVERLEAAIGGQAGGEAAPGEEPAATEQEAAPGEEPEAPAAVAAEAVEAPAAAAAPAAEEPAGEPAAEEPVRAHRSDAAPLLAPGCPDPRLTG